ncbi:MAG TPA: ARMT1-like domain-containing protein [Devosia sp.]|nr:ARMT1-like domain-containing protein [Devosia sp.]
MRSGSEAPGDRYRRFVADTMAARIPLIIRNAEDGQDDNAVRQLKALAKSVEADGPMVIDLGGWTLPGWEDMPARVNGRRPSQAPFFDFEFWMYYRILSAVRFAQSRIDPFRAIKHRDLDRHLAWADQALPKTATLADGLRLSLAANAHDLSQIARPVATHEVGLSKLDFDPTGLRRLNIICDNFGAEFVADLILAVVAAEAGIDVVLHVKQLPMFVSDTTSDDVTIVLDRLGARSDFGQRLSAAIRVGSIGFGSHPFWSAPQFFDKLPLDELKPGVGTLTVLKGDLNFRRAVGDVSVAAETPFQALAILPSAPMLSLRSIKSYCVAGMDEWPASVPKDKFPMDGTIVAVQQIPVREAAIVGAESSSERAPLLRRVRQWLRR